MPRPENVSEFLTRDTTLDWPRRLIAEDARNLVTIVTSVGAGGWGLDAVWADDFHHQVRRLTTGDSEAYFRDFSGSVSDLATTVNKGWFFCGQHSVYRGGPRGTDPAGVPLERFVICLQNHDQVGNRALGERLHHQIDLAMYRAITTLLLCAPEAPLLFMGQEWAATTPFLYFTDHHEELGRLVTEGRRREFRQFSAFAVRPLFPGEGESACGPRDARSRGARASGGGAPRALKKVGVKGSQEIPDPQAKATFEASRLNWRDLSHASHAGVQRLYRALLRLRRTEPALRTSVVSGALDIEPLDEMTLLMSRTAPDERSRGSSDPRGGSGLVVVVYLGPPRHPSAAAAPGTPGRRIDAGTSRMLARDRDLCSGVVLTSEDEQFAVDPRPPVVVLTEAEVSVTFARPGAVILSKGRRPTDSTRPGSPQQQPLPSSAE